MVDGCELMVDRNSRRSSTRNYKPSTRYQDAGSVEQQPKLSSASHCGTPASALHA